MSDASDALRERREELRKRASLLQGDDDSRSVAVELRRVADWCDTHGIDADVYGEGAPLQAFEARVADMLGHNAARFMPSGTMAQQIAVRIWCDRMGTKRLGMHPTCHLELHEHHGYERLHGLSRVLVGDARHPMRAEDFLAAAEPIGAIIVELPTRENGGQLAPWDDLVALCDAARDRGVATHLDGARLWEAAAGYDRDLDEICALFDSTYVSFYKGIGALPGSMLLGSVDFIEEATVWQRRHGGNLFTQLPNWVSAEMRLDAQIAKMPGLLARARSVAALLGGIEGITTNPDMPHTSMFHVFLAGGADDLLEARDRVAEDHGLWLFGGLQSTDVPGIQKFELTVGDAAVGIEDEAIVAAFTELLSRPA